MEDIIRDCTEERVQTQLLIDSLNTHLLESGILIIGLDTRIQEESFTYAPASHHICFIEWKSEEHH